MRKLTLLTASALLATSLSYGAAYQLNLQGLRQLAMGGTGTATPWDVSTLFYNPAGLSLINGIQAYGSAQFIMPSTGYAQSTYTTNTQSQTFTSFNVYLGGPLQKDSKVGLGIGVYTPFGDGLTWDNNWLGRYVIQKIYLQTIFIQPTVSYKLNDYISAGIGFIYATGNVVLKQALPVQMADGTDAHGELKGGGNGTGFNAGIHVRASDQWQFGVTYRSRVNLKLNGGNATFTVPQSLTTQFPNTTFNSRLPLPAVFSVGIGYKPSAKWSFQADVNFTQWSAFDSLNFDYAQTTSALSNTHLPFKYKNTVTYRLGASYQVNSKIGLMAGGAWDPTPVTDGFVSPVLPDADRIVLTGGVTYMPCNRVTILAAVEYVTTKKMDNRSYDYANFSGTYQTKAITPAIGICYHF
ncbi:MAG: outer membrane protein transport protein [Taibaiella sp.]|nr:outer membrane protein transport protein [Taibaiella sp.]